MMCLVLWFYVWLLFFWGSWKFRLLEGIGSLWKGFLGGEELLGSWLGSFDWYLENL